MPGGIDLAAAEAWVRETLRPTGPFELVKERPWATVFRVPVGRAAAFFKACRPIQAFEPRLSAALASRWPDRVATVRSHDRASSWAITVATRSGQRLARAALRRGSNA